MNRNRNQPTLTPRQFAQRRGTSLYFVYHELWANRLPGARKVGKSWRIPLAALEERLNVRKGQ
jgi:hypothetical protein